MKPFTLVLALVLLGPFTCAQKTGLEWVELQSLQGVGLRFFNLSLVEGSKDHSYMVSCALQASSETSMDFRVLARFNFHGKVEWNKFLRAISTTHADKQMDNNGDLLVTTRAAGAIVDWGYPWRFQSKWDHLGGRSCLAQNYGHNQVINKAQYRTSSPQVDIASACYLLPNTTAVHKHII